MKRLLRLTPMLALCGVLLSAPVSASITKTTIPGFQAGIVFDSLPLEKANVRVRGNGERKIALIADPSCPISRRQEQALEEMDNVTIYTFVEDLLKQPLGREYTQAIRCQDGNDAQASAWENWMLKGESPPAAKACQFKSVKVDLGALTNGNGRPYTQISPTVIFSNNVTTNGFIGIDELNEIADLVIEP